MRTPGPSSPRTEHAGGARDEVGPALLILTRAYLGVISPIVGGLPHGPRGYHTLGAVIRGDHPSQLALAMWLGIDRTVMTYLLDDLVAAGLVERQQNPTDRRQVLLKITPAGTTLVREDRRRRDTFLAQAMASTLTPTERELLRLAAGLMDKLSEVHE